jgi:hypothetical protein
VELIEMETDVNDDAFAERLCEVLDGYMAATGRGPE